MNDATGWAYGFESEVMLGLMIAAWILWELYGRSAVALWTEYASYIRMVGGSLFIIYIWWYANTSTEGLETTMGLAKQLLKDSAGSITREKRNVTPLMKKRVAASQQWKCGACKKTLDETYEVDHSVALFNGGTNDISNLVALCPHCHRKKTVDERLVA